MDVQDNHQITALVLCLVADHSTPDLPLAQQDGSDSYGPTETQLDLQLNLEPNMELGTKLDTKSDTKIDSELDSELSAEHDTKLDLELDSELDSELSAELDTKLDLELDTELEIVKVEPWPVHFKDEDQTPAVVSFVANSEERSNVPVAPFTGPHAHGFTIGGNSPEDSLSAGGTPDQYTTLRWKIWRNLLPNDELSEDEDENELVVRSKQKKEDDDPFADVRNILNGEGVDFQIRFKPERNVQVNLAQAEYAQAQKKYENPFARLATFKTFESAQISAVQCADYGFRHPEVGELDEISCPFCLLCVHGFQERIQPLALHKAYAQGICSFLDKLTDELLTKNFNHPLSSNPHVAKGMQAIAIALHYCVWFSEHLSNDRKFMVLF